MVKLLPVLGGALLLAVAGCSHTDREVNAPTTNPESDSMQSQVTDMPAPPTPSPAVEAPTPAPSPAKPETGAIPPSPWTDTDGLTDYGKRIFETPQHTDLPAPPPR